MMSPTRCGDECMKKEREVNRPVRVPSYLVQPRGSPDWPVPLSDASMRTKALKIHAAELPKDHRSMTLLFFAESWDFIKKKRGTEDNPDSSSAKYISMPFCSNLSMPQLASHHLFSSRLLFQSQQNNFTHSCPVWVYPPCYPSRNTWSWNVPAEGVSHR